MIGQFYKVIESESYLNKELQNVIQFLCHIRNL